MSTSRHITIVVHERDPYPERTRHCLWTIADVWREQGHDVEIVRGPSQPRPETDLVIPQVDRTVLPQRFRHYLEPFPRVVNRRVVDISKRRISRNLVDRDAPWDGPVIVKTDRNYGGLPEAKRLPRSLGELVSRIQSRRKAASRGDFRWLRAIPTGEYPVFPSLDRVPESVWNNRHLVVERYIPEQVDGYTCIRVCLVLGDVWLNRRLYANSQVIKGATESSEELPLPEEVKDFSRELGLDYGKIDYVVHDGEVHVLDANRSPGVVADDEVTEGICRKLAVGLDHLLAADPAVDPAVEGDTA